MRRLALLGTLIASAIMSLTMLAAPAQAQATRTWVSGVGDDANPCSRTAPCKTFAGAISKTAPGGQIDCLDPGGFGAVTITKSIGIECLGLSESVLVSGTNGIVISAAATDVVRLVGLDIDGLGNGQNSGNTGLSGIVFNSGAALEVKDCFIHGFSKVGIIFTPNSAAKLDVINTQVWTNGVPSIGQGAGIFVKPSAGTTSVSISRTDVHNNTIGVQIDGSSAPVKASIADSVFANNTNAGILSVSAGQASTTMVNRSVSANNGTGISVTGSGAVLRIGQSTISGNGTAVSISAPGVATSFGTNQINDNAAAGSALPIVGPT